MSLWERAPPLESSVLRAAMQQTEQYRLAKTCRQNPSQIYEHVESLEDESTHIYVHTRRTTGIQPRQVPQLPEVVVQIGFCQRLTDR